ncbi:MAG: glycosyltransferase family 2 protein [Patescibacteria group bacterium]
MVKRLLKRIPEYRQYRLLEIFPGAMVWVTFVLAIALSFIRPVWAIFFIIVFDFYWLVRILYMLFFMITSFRRYRQTIKQDWRKKVEQLPDWDQYYHAVFYPTYKEPIEVIRGSLASLVQNNYPLDRFIVVLAGEEKDREHFTALSETLRREMGGSFFKFLVTLHPSGIEGEMPGKGSNIAWAGHRVKDLLDELHIPYDKVIASAFDADTCVHPQYFSYLTYTYATHPNPTHASYQPLAVFNNNVWESPALTRVISYSTTFWLMTEQVRPERLFTFSSHSMSFQALVEVGFWQSDIVTEDSRICLQCIMEYDGNYEVVPLHIPVSMDVVVGHTFWETVKSQYVQQRRWAYGVENFPYMVWNFTRNTSMPFLQKMRYIFNQGEGVYSWATAPILIFILGHLPIWLANYQGSTSVVTQNAPHILSWIMNAAMIGLLTQAVLSTRLLPPKPKNYPNWKLVIMVLQWILIPVTLIVFGSIPATDAQTRLMLGKYLGFQVTKKVRK